MSSQNPSSWANLPPDLLLSITDSLDVPTSVGLSIVCTSWAKTICRSFPPFCRGQPVPWLLCCAQNSDTNLNCSVLTFYDLSTAAYYYVRIPVPSLRGHHWLGSYRGWLVTHDTQLQIHAIKPLTGTHVLLPSIKKEHPKKIIMCHFPYNNKIILAFCLTQQGSLLFTILGDGIWTCMGNYRPVPTCQDIIVHRGKVYAITMNTLYYWNVRDPSFGRMLIISDLCSCWTKYLLQWNGELVMLMIDKKESASLENHKPKQVQLYKFKIVDDYVVSLNSISSIGDDALFFSANCSYVVSSSGRNDIRGNCIYFTNQMSRCSHNAQKSLPNHNFGVFDLGEQTYKPCCAQDSSMHFPPPSWFWPC
ncbi:putative F-box protein At4g17565 [Carex rostrata]